MKPRVGVYLSKRTAARLTTTARRRGTSKSALVEAALDRFLDADGVRGASALADRLGELSGQIDQLDRNLGIVSEIVGLHAQFHLAVTPDLPAARQPYAPRPGGANFDQGTLRRTSPTEKAADAAGAAHQRTRSADQDGHNSRGSAHYAREAGSRSSRVDPHKETAAVREDGSASTFLARRRSPLH
jgi:hypothetical protein